MDGRDRAWLEVRVDGSERWRFPTSEFEAAMAAASALLDENPQSIVEVVRCSEQGGRGMSILFMRNAAEEEPEPANGD